MIEKFTSFAPTDVEPRIFHGLLLHMVIPRPIGFISTMSANGRPNLAPFSYFQALSVQPPALMFSPNRDRHGRLKHSYLNVRATGEFVASMVTEDMGEAMNLASGDFPDGVSEFEKAGFTAVKSELVKPFRVGESPVNMECRVLHIIDLSDKPLGGSVIIGEIVKVHLRVDIYDSASGRFVKENYHPIARLGDSDYSPIRDVFNMPRPKMTPDGEVVPGSYQIIKGKDE